MSVPSNIVLIADDDEFFRMALRVVLEVDLGVSDVLEASTLDGAIEQLSRNEGIDLALFDLGMPGMDSPGNLRAVREYHPDLPIAVVSGSERRSDILLALASGVNGYVPKSLGAAKIGQILKSVWQGVIYVPPSITKVDCEDEDFIVCPRGSSVPKASLKSLTPRQREVLELLIEGKSNKQIAQQLTLGEGTVKVHISALFRTLGAANRSAAAVNGSKLLNSS